MSEKCTEHLEACNVAWLKFQRDYGNVLTGDKESQRLIFTAGFSAGLERGIDDTVRTALEHMAK